MRTPPPADDRPRHAPARKDRKRWCRGKVGVPHRPAIRMGDKYTHSRKECGWWTVRSKVYPWWRCVEQEYCVNCGKILRYDLGDACTKRSS